jgi:hypothetical protein
VGGGALVQSDERNDSYHSIISDLVCLFEHVPASMRLMESAIGSETSSGNRETAANVVALDDVTPRYMKANAALNACNAGPGAALHYLRDTRSSKHGTDAPAESARRAVRSIGRV